jgi:hypothetical protein
LAQRLLTFAVEKEESNRATQWYAQGLTPLTRNNRHGSGKEVLMSRKKERRIMVRMKPTLLGLLLMLLLVGGGTQAVAQSTRPEGRITLESTSIAAGVGVDWGDGTLRFHGRNYKFSVSGLSLGDWGISKVNAAGDVYNLARPADLAGTYVAGEAGVALGAGADALVLRNQHGVVITLSAVQEGARLTLGASGMTISLQ